MLARHIFVVMAMCMVVFPVVSFSFSTYPQPSFMPGALRKLRTCSYKPAGWNIVGVPRAQDRPGGGCRYLRASYTMDNEDLEQRSGTIEHGSAIQGENVMIRYTPPAGMFKDGAPLTYIGGCNGWDGDADPIAFPLLAVGESRFQANVNVPKDAKVLDFVVTDGVIYDTNGGGYFHIPVSSQVELQAIADASSGVIEYGSGALGVGDSITLTYTPPKGFFSDDAVLYYMGGFNKWDGEREPIVFPLVKDQGDSYKCCITVPNFAQQLDFIFSDGVRYDTNNGQYFHIAIQRIQVQDDKRIDPEVAKVNDELQGEIDEMMKDVKKGDLLPKDISLPQKERELMMMRSEASFIGEKEGLSNIQISEVRDYFDEAARSLEDGSISATITRAAAKRLLMDKLAFPLSDQDVASLLEEYVDLVRPGAEDVTLPELLRIVSKLEREDVGIVIV